MKKKLLVILLAILTVFTLVGCKKKEEIEEVAGEDIVGGFQELEDHTLTDEYKEIFEKAMEGYTGMNFEPLEILAKQVVAGMNYRFLVNATAVVPNAETVKKIVTVYQDLSGNCSITNVEDYE